MKEHTMEERLWDYIDGISSPEEKTVIEQLIVSQAQWKEKYSELLEVHQLVNAAGLEEPSMRFTKNVMDEIARVHIAPATKSYINKNIIRGLAFFFITMLVCFFIYALGQINWTAGGDSKIPVDISSIDYSRIFNNNFVNALMLINVVLGLFLLDRYLAAKRQKYMENKG
ncbi:MAG TPA: hypothetical protein PKC69_08740 [Chitinophagaceae bacterium]|nr:hypothetical protein [Chitinophagaceae bacterium]